MTTYVAFLGGINVGGHRVSMERLRAEFEELGFGAVSTFIASGNVVFAATGKPAALERRIETHLERALGYGVPTFVRSAAAVRRLAGLDPFGALADGETYVVAFLRSAPAAAAVRATEALSNERDTLEVHGSELHWRIRGGVSDSSIKPAVLAEAVGGRSTTRNTKSLRKLAVQLGR